jgi:hypothetical protein
MSKIQKSNKETKKQPALSKKEKKAAKDEKKNSRGSAQPFTMPKD